MLETRIGAFTVTRVEEMLTPGFDPAFLFPQFDPAIYDEMGDRIVSQGYLRPPGVAAPA